MERVEELTKVLGILGASYSGTTVMTMILGGMSHCFPAGETHWLRDNPPTNFFCRVCGGSCVYWTDDLRAELLRTNTWWSTIRGGFSEYSWLVSSDKIPHFYAENSGVDRYLLQWKDPRGWYWSAKRHQGYTPERAIVSWTGLYYRAFDLIDSETVPVSLNDWDLFCASPLARLNSLLADLDLAPLSQLPAKNPNHMIGGNGEAIGLNTSQSYRDQFGAGIVPDTRWQSELDPDEARGIIEDRRVADVLDRLRNFRFRAAGSLGDPGGATGG